MNISQKKKTALYNALDDPIMNLRLEINRNQRQGNPITVINLDEKLYKIVFEIWGKQKTVLGIED